MRLVAEDRDGNLARFEAIPGSPIERIFANPTNQALTIVDRWGYITVYWRDDTE